MMLDHARIRAIAAALDAAERDVRAIPPPGVPDLESAVSIAFENVTRRIDRDDPVVGKTIDATLDGPCFGHLFVSLAIPDRGTARRSQFVRPRAAPAFALVFDAAPSEAQLAEADFACAASHLIPALAIFDSRIAEPAAPSRFDAIADNASVARFVLGSYATPIDALAAGADDVTLRKNDAVVASSALDAAAIAFRAAATLARTLAPFGIAVEAGDVVLAMLPPFRPADVEAGDVVQAVFSRLGSVAMSLE